MREQTGFAVRHGQKLAHNERPVVQSNGPACFAVHRREENFQNLPVIFQLISPSMHRLPANLQSDLLAVLQALAGVPRRDGLFLAPDFDPGQRSVDFPG